MKNMKNRYLSALISSLLSIGPVVVIIIALALVFQFMNTEGLIKFQVTDYILLIVGMFVLVIGLALFQIGVSSSLSKVGEYMGTSLSKQSSLFIIILFSLVLGTLITCAEPSILIVSKQVAVPSFVLIGGIALGVGIFVVIGVLRIIFHGSLKVWYLLFYFITFLLICLVCISPDADKRAFLPFIFDSGGVTTGSATVPFILSLGAGIATVRGGRNSTKDSFGLVGMASVGPIITMTILILVSKNKTTVSTYASMGDPNILGLFINKLIPTSDTSLGSLVEVAIALSPILLIFFIYELIFIKLPKEEILKLLVGFAFSYVGLSLFLCATSAVMTPIGYAVGQNIGSFNKAVIVIVAFLIGLVTILCEPAVHVLTGQMETISDGRVTKLKVLITLSLGVGIAIALSALRAVTHLNIMYIVIPGYGLSLVLMFFCPDIYTAMAFDSGGTASGPMSTSFVLPLIIGITTKLAPEGTTQEELGNLIYSDAFGVVALIALTPVLAIQFLGVWENAKGVYMRFITRKHIMATNDAQIIHF